MPRKNARPAAKKLAKKKALKLKKKISSNLRNYPVSTSLDPIVGLAILSSLAFGGRK